MLTTEKLQELMKLKMVDKEAFYRKLEEMARANPLDVLLNYKKFKDYGPNV